MWNRIGQPAMTDDRKTEQENRIKRDIREYGGPVLRSGIWNRAMRQTHHNRWTVGSHSMSVCVAALRMSYWLEDKHICYVNHREIVQAALCHDLGIVGRYEKFANNRVCCHQHPLDSAEIARHIYPEISEKTLYTIRCHMWPLCVALPKTREAVIITLADKYVATGEGIPADWLERYQKALNATVLRTTVPARN